MLGLPALVRVANAGLFADTGNSLKMSQQYLAMDRPRPGGPEKGVCFTLSVTVRKWLSHSSKQWRSDSS